MASAYAPSANLNESVSGSFVRATLTLLLFVACVQAQSAAFEQADVQPSAPGAKEGCGFLPEGRFECSGATMLRLIATAYDRNPDTIAGGPDWLASDRFDVVAKAPSRTATPAVMRTMLQSLLAARFGLAVHNDQRDLPVYLLTVGKHGSRLREVPATSSPACPAMDGSPGLIHRACRAFTMAALTDLLPKVARQYVDRPVIDSTGLAGAYDFELDWMSKAVWVATRARGDKSDAISIFDALHNSGLELKPGTHPSQALVIDHVDRTPVDSGHATAPPEFDVSEVHPSRNPGKHSLSALPDGQVEILGYTLRELITLAFELTPDRVADGPKWLDSEHYDVIAKSPSAMSPHAVSAMLKTLIVRRFQLQTHSEDRPVKVFALLAGKHPKLKEATAGARSECRLTLAEKGRAYVCGNTTMAQFVDRLPNVAQAYFTHPFLDFTSLPGAYDFTLTWTPKGRLPAAAAQPADAMPQASTPTGDQTVFEAVEKQLGLKVEEQMHPMPVVVIDRVTPAEMGN